MHTFAHHNVFEIHSMLLDVSVVHFFYCWVVSNIMNISQLFTYSLVNGYLSHFQLKLL